MVSRSQRHCTQNFRAPFGELFCFYKKCYNIAAVAENRAECKRSCVPAYHPASGVQLSLGPQQPKIRQLRRILVFVACYVICVRDIF